MRKKPMNALTLAATALTFAVLCALEPRLAPQPAMTPGYELEDLVQRLDKMREPLCLGAKPLNKTYYTCFEV
jgi:hypothetical protein